MSADMISDPTFQKWLQLCDQGGVVVILGIFLFIFFTKYSKSIDTNNRLMEEFLKEIKENTIEANHQNDSINKELVALRELINNLHNDVKLIIYKKKEN